jgi:hypothetical protein
MAQETKPDASGTIKVDVWAPAPKDYAEVPRIMWSVVLKKNLRNAWLKATSPNNGNYFAAGPPVQKPWYTTCTANAIGSGLLHVGIDAIGLIPEGGLVVAGAGKFAVGMISTGAGSLDTSPIGLTSSGLGVLGIATTLGKAVPVVGQAISVASMGLDVINAGIAIANCH